MSRPHFAWSLLLVILAVPALGDEKHNHASTAPSHAGLDKLKSLVGTWVVADKDGQPTEEVASVIKLTAGGTAIHETLFPGQPHEMVSIYTADGPDLVMTHYCMLGNQPRMKADPKSPANQIVFQFAGGSNLDPKKDKHMHAATLTFVDADHIEVHGVGWENGEPAKEMCGELKLVRKKE
ncbi:MAG: hypothetical protein MUF06_12795 [Pirellulaceae bacterium]|jgi:hypothetical protein|nr:hypothetical protein [Pirellulaceae bacterium]